MGFGSWWHWLIFLGPAFILLIVTPFFKILPRAGISKWISVLVVVPGVGLLLLCIQALAW